MSQNIAKIRSKHQGRAYVRLVQDSFTIQGPFGEHLAMGFEPLREPIWLLGRRLGTVEVRPTVANSWVDNMPLWGERAANQKITDDDRDTKGHDKNDD